MNSTNFQIKLCSTNNFVINLSLSKLYKKFVTSKIIKPFELSNRELYPTDR